MIEPTNRGFHFVVHKLRASELLLGMIVNKKVGFIKYLLKYGAPDSKHVYSVSVTIVVGTVSLQCHLNVMNTSSRCC